MKRPPAVSVIVTIYNQEKYIGKCVRSIIGQNFPNGEIILVNDGSTDRSLKICQKYAQRDSRIVIINKHNEGLVAARKDGVLKARGEYICFVDGDDYLAKGALDHLYSIASLNNLDMVVGRPNRVYDSWGLIKWNLPHIYNGERILKKNEILPLFFEAQKFGVHGYAIAVWGRLYRRSCVLLAMEKDPNTLFPPYKEFEDWLFNLSIAPYINSMWNTNTIISSYRYGGATCKDYFVLRGGGGYYFDTKFERCILFNYVNILPSLFSHYVFFLGKDIARLYCKTLSKGKILDFVNQEISTRKIILWARENMDKVHITSPLGKAILNNDVTKIWEIAQEDGEKLHQYHRKMKIVIAYQKVMDFIGKIEECFV